ncbi:MAG: DnaJ C-terminal domain-containing protein [Gammaproteobacteria bacterium]
MEYKDYYKILGVDRNATPEQIKKQYRILAQKYHPDVSKEPDCKSKFLDIQEAYSVLKNPEKRQAYDQLGSNPTGNGFTPPPNWNFQGGEEEFTATDYSDFFETLFGRAAHARRARPASQRGQDLHSKILLTLEEAYRGGERTLQLQDPVLDPATGYVTHQTRTLKVKIPAGVTEGQQIRLAKQGGKGLAGGPDGDLYLEIELAPHAFYQVKDRDIVVNLPVTPWEAALGAKVPVKTLGGEVELTIPAASQTGTTLRLKGRGLSGKTPGDQLVTLQVYTPPPHTDAQRQLYQNMAQQMPFNPRH